MNNKVLIAVLAVIVVAVGFWYWGGNGALQPDDAMEQQEEVMDKGSESANTAGSERPVRTVENGHYVTFVYFNGTSFSPATVTVDHGESVRFVNESSLAMRIGTRVESLSSPKYADIDQAQVVGKGETYEVFFSEPGTWAYQNLPSAATGIYGTVNIR